MVGDITIEKSFDKGSRFSKKIEDGDIEEFFRKEGEYLERLSKTLQEHGQSGESFTVTYTVEVTV